MEKHIVWNGHDSYQLSDFKDCTKVTVESSPLYYATLLRFLTLILREKDVLLILGDELKEIASLTGFSNLLE